MVAHASHRRQLELMYLIYVVVELCIVDAMIRQQRS